MARVIAVLAQGDLVDCIDQQLADANDATSADRLADLRDALVVPMRNIYGVSDEVATMAFSILLCLLHQREMHVPHI